MNAFASRAAALSVAIILSAGITGCSKEADQPNTSAEMSFQNEPAAIESEPVQPSRPIPKERTPVATNTAEMEREQLSIPPEAPVSRDAQMLDDAGASGMTARLPSTGDETPATDTNQSDAAAR